MDKKRESKSPISTNFPSIISQKIQLYQRQPSHPTFLRNFISVISMVKRFTIQSHSHHMNSHGKST